MSHPKNAKREPLSEEGRKRTLFIKGFTGRDIVTLLEQKLGIKMNRNALKVEQREGSRGMTYTIVCSRQEEANAILEEACPEGYIGLGRQVQTQNRKGD